MNHPESIVPQDFAEFRDAKMGKSTLFMSERMLVGLNAFEPGQEHALHAHADQDKVYLTLEGRGVFLLDDREIEMEAGRMLIAPEGVPHGIRNTSEERLIVLMVMAPAPG
ncbi:MAG: cupin domain-containing protein [Gemmatimonadetes bacterium]|nr:cupin domain-containing protein [Gemmatimonadota bacterium]NNL31418.1 cupin domain-containing protein [Gemmatimonadota bacterium]